MRVDFRYPAFAFGVPPRLRKPRETVCMLDGTVDIPEVPQDEAPLACRIEWPGLHEAFRWRDGRFFRAVGSVAAVGSSADGRTRLSSVGAAMFLAMADYVEADKTRAANVWPLSTKTWLDRLRRPGRDRGELMREYRILLESELPVPLEKIADVDSGGLAEWTEKANSIACGLFVCGGALWQETVEPLLFINYGFGYSLDLGSVAAYGPEASRYLRSMSDIAARVEADFVAPHTVGGDGFLVWSMAETERLRSFLIGDDFDEAEPIGIRADRRTAVDLKRTRKRLIPRP